MSQRDHSEIQDLIAAYALGALPEEEVRIVRAHIMECDECMGEADDYLETTWSLALSVEPVEPPPGFAERVLAEARRPKETGEAPARVVRPSRWRDLAPAFALGLAALVAILMAAVTLETRQDLERTETVLASLLRADGMRMEGVEGAAARLVPEDDGATLIVAGLPEKDSDETYQLWYLGEETPVSAGTFETGEDLTVVEVDADVEGFEGAAVTIEPRGGSEQPTTDPVIASV